MGKIRFDFKIDVVDRCALDSVALLLLLLSFDSPVFSFLMLAVKLFDFLSEGDAVADGYSSFICSKNDVLPALSNPKISTLYCSRFVY